MRSTTVALALMSSLAAAENIVTSLWIPGFDPQPLVASVLSTITEASATVYSIGCPPGTDSDECGAGMGFTLTEGPGTASVNMVDGASSLYWVGVACDITTSAAKAVCTESDGGSEDPEPSSLVTTISGASFSSNFMPVTVLGDTPSGTKVVTASAGPLITGPATSTSAPVSTSSSSTTTSAGSSSTSAVSSGSAGSKASSSSTGGMPQITGNAYWAVGGAAVALALAEL